MRNPNGYGTIYKLSGKRRRPYIVRKTTGWEMVNGRLKQLYDTIGYYATRPEAMKALSDYNSNPYSIETATVTFQELYEKLMSRKTDKISYSNTKGYAMAFNICSSLHELKFVDIRTDHMQKIIDTCGKGYGTLRKIKVLFNQLYDYAMENDVVSKSYSDYVKLPENEEESTRIPFPDDEIKILWDNLNTIDFIDTILIMIYSGLRIGELLIIKNADININERYMRGGIKTAAGKNRVIPINKKILPLIQNRMGSSEYLILNNFGKKMKYDNYKREKWERIMTDLSMKHNPHDCRHTCATLLDNAGANKLSIKRILGHASSDITDKVYTHKDIEELKKAIDLI